MQYFIVKMYDLMKKMLGSSNDGSYAPVITETVQGISVERGNAYKLQLFNDNLGGGINETFLLRTPADKNLTFKLDSLICIDTVTAQQAVIDIGIYEAGTVTADGADTNYLLTNFNRNSTNVCGCTVGYNPTVSDNGVPLAYYISSADISFTPDVTFQLKPDTDYIFTVCNNINNLTCTYIITSKLYVVPEE